MSNNIKGSVPVKVAARVYGKSSSWVREGIICGWLDIGIATRNGEKITSTSAISFKNGRINFYISPIKLFKDTGYMWDGTKK